MALPELYTEQEFQRQTFDRNSQFMKHNPNLTARGTRKFNRYWNSDQRLEDEKAFNAEQDAAEVAHIEAEAKTRFMDYLDACTSKKEIYGLCHNTIQKAMKYDPKVATA